MESRNQTAAGEVEPIANALVEALTQHLNNCSETLLVEGAPTNVTYPKTLPN
jgi:hypothetical protein